MKKAQISIILPVYHEEKNILQVLQIIKKTVKTPHEIIIVYDSKTDPTYALLAKNLKDYPVRLLQNATGEKKGVLQAIKTGFFHAKADVIVVVMADCSDDVSQIDAMYQKMQTGYDIVCASRYMKNGKKIGGEILKSLLSRLGSLSLFYLFHIPTHDATNAFKMYRKSIFNKIKIESKEGFAYSLEIIIKAHKMGYKITEIPTTWKDREKGTSHFKLFRWLPSYLKIYTMIFEKSSFFSFFTNHYVMLFFLYITTLSLQVLSTGYILRHTVTIGSTLDFSWKSDLIERFLHGFIAGKDFVFTYGPLFQFLVSIPAIVFHIPSYASVIMVDSIIVSLIFIGTYILVRLITQNKNGSLSLLIYLLFVIGLLAQGIFEQIARILPILIFALLFYAYVYKQKQLTPRIIGISLLPSLFGLYSYDLFIQCLLISLIFFTTSLYEYITTKRNSIHVAIFLICVLVFQIFTSMLLTGNFLYLQTSWDTLANYFYVMNIAWAFGTSNVLLIFPLMLPLLFLFIWRSQKVTSDQKKILLILTLTAVLQLRTAFIRSDEGHIIAGVYPSIIVGFLMLFYLLQERFTTYIVIFSFLFMLVPYKITYDRIFSPKNIVAVTSFMQSPKPFTDLYSLPNQYSFTMEEIKSFSSLIQKNPGNVFVYPYDNYILNTKNQTFNSYALQLYAYSASPTEQETVRRLKKNSPTYIIMGIDGKAALALDDIPNLTRNPLIARFILENYILEKQTSRYFILRFYPNKQTLASVSCSLQKITFQPPKENVISAVFGKSVKSPLYYLRREKQNIRLPYKPNTQSYLVFDSYNAKKLANLFSQKIVWDNKKISQEKFKEVVIIKKWPFSKKETVYDAKDVDLSVYCLN